MKILKIYVQETENTFTKLLLTITHHIANSSRRIAIFMLNYLTLAAEKFNISILWLQFIVLF